MRSTRQTLSIRELLEARGHASNAELHEALQTDDISQTTVHRITKRLSDNSMIAIAPRGVDGEVRYDSNIEPHHHFMCSCCGRLCDIPTSDALNNALSVLKSVATECAFGSSVTLMGVCINCVNKEK